jgi:hypothetical protein
MSGEMECSRGGSARLAAQYVRDLEDPSQGFMVGSTVNREENTLGIRMASISRLLPMPGARLSESDREPCLCLSGPHIIYRRKVVNGARVSDK